MQTSKTFLVDSRSSGGVRVAHALGEYTSDTDL